MGGTRNTFGPVEEGVAGADKESIVAMGEVGAGGEVREGDAG